jgi:CheY-like chemotaxis protein
MDEFNPITYAGGYLPIEDHGLIGDGSTAALVADIGMPGEDGYSLMRKIRRLPSSRGGTVPALALTACARPEDRARALIAGFQQYVAKPVEPDELTAVVAKLAERSDAHEV